MNLNQFIGKNQLSVMRRNCRSEEGEFFKEMIENLKETIATMPKTYETDGLGDEATATLHYFNPSSDWWIIERDAGDENGDDQIQAFGYACLNGDSDCAELGYISIQELLEYGAELDLYYKPEKIGDIKKRVQGN